MPLDLFQSQVPAVMRGTFLRAKREAEEARLIEAGQRVEILHDDWKDLLILKLQQIYRAKKIRDRIPETVSTEHNVLKRIATELATVYKWGATRELAVKAQNVIARQLYEECRADEVLERANFYLNPLRDLLLIPRVVDGRLKIDIALPDRTTVIQHEEDPSQALGFWTQRTLSHTTGYPIVEYLYADAERWKLVRSDGSVRREWEHGLGRLPAVVVHADERVGEFWDSSAFSDAVEATLSVGCDLFRLHRMFQWQSELQPTFSGNPRKVAKGLTVGGDTLWAAEGQWGVLHLQADPTHLLQTIRARIGWIAAQYGLAADVYDLSATANSGLQIRLKRAPLMEQRARQIKRWRRVERELLMLIAMVS